MKRIFSGLAVLLLIVLHQSAVHSQGTAGSIAGTVVDSTGAVVPNATIVVKGESGQEFTAAAADNGTFKIPAVAAGTYTVTVSSANFKTFIVQNVKVDVGLPSTVDAVLEAGRIEETVVVTSGAEVLQTQTATIGTTITGRQILETPIPSRDALDLVTMLPGTNTVGAPRRSSVNGLPKGSLSITIDGVDVQDNLLRSSDGFFTYVRPRVDAIEEVTVSTAAPGAESGGDGAVQIRFVTRRGTNDYSGGLFYQHRNDFLNANYWYNNRDGLPRQKMRLNQYGARFGGPIPFLNFGEGVPLFSSGRDKRFFFVNYEEFRLPEALTRTRTVLNSDAELGLFRYVTGSGVSQPINLLNIARDANTANPALNLPTTADPTVAATLARIRAATATEGTFTPITNDPNRQFYNFTPTGGQVRKFLAMRFDFNLTKNHSLENVTNVQKFSSVVDFLNSQESRFPGFPFYSQGSDRNSNSTALRSTLTKNIINEARFNHSWGYSSFSPEISAADFNYSGGYLLDISAAGVTTPYSRNSFSSRTSPTWEFTDSLTWIKGSHTINFGGQFKRIGLVDINQARIVPTISFGLDSTDPANAIFNSTTLPGATPTQIAEARSLYATLVGRVTGFTSTAYLTSDGTYQLNAQQERRARQDTFGLYAQDSWRVRPGLTINYGLRWQPQGSYVLLTENYARLSSFEQVYGVSGLGNIFKPGTLTGTVPTVVGIKAGEKAYPDDRNNLAPSVGVVWSPDFGERGFLRSIFGASGRSVFRGGYSISYVREGTALIASLLGANPGGNLSASRSLTIANSLTVGTNLRTPGNTNITPNTFASTPSYPLTLTTANSANAFDPNIKTGSVHSFSVGYQREIDKNTVVEVRYVGNRGYDLFRQYNINQFNTIENGFGAEFVLAQANLYANEAAFAAGQANRRYCPGFVNTVTGACQVSATNAAAVTRIPTFAFFGTGTNTSPLPIIQSYFNSAANFSPTDPARYGGSGGSTAANALGANFANTTLVTGLSRNAANVFAFSGASFESNATRRANAIANGRPSNFFYVNPTTPGGAFILDNSAKSWYDSGVIEVRRRLSDGLRFQASYVWSKAQSDSFQSNSDNFANYSLRENGREVAKNVAVFDIRHAFKFDATYDLPFGKGGAFFSGASGFANALVGGWTILPTIRWQSGSPFSLGNVQLVGMTKQELQKEIKVRKGPGIVTFLPDDIIVNTQRAFDINVASATGYGTTYGGAPEGRFIAPAGYGNCLQLSAGDCGFNNLILYGPSFFKLDVSVSKKFMIGERRNVEFRATFLDALNRPNFRIGGWNTDVVALGVGGSTFGQLLSGSAYQDVSTTNDPGGRIVDLMLRINF